MHPYLLAAAIAAAIVGLVHSVLGEVLIFSRMRSDRQIIPTVGKPLLHERHVRILWATWHIASIFGWALAAVLFSLAQPASEMLLQEVVVHAIAGGMFASGLLVLIATKGKHPGWLGLLVVAALCWLS
ncbi:MAG: hypothetical protein AAF564_21045 [Bacteroidota bacterium]